VSDLIHRVAVRARSTPVVLVALVVLFLAFEEVDRVAGQFPGTQSNTLSILGMTGPLALTRIGGWEGWAATLGPDPVIPASPWAAIVLYLVLDLAFIGVYSYLISRGIARWMPPVAGASQKPGAELTDDERARRLARWRAVVAWLMLLAADVVEDALLGVAAGVLVAHAPFPLALQWAIAAAATVKFGALALLVLSFVLLSQFRGDVRVMLRRGWHAVYAQRLSVVVVLVLAALSLLPPWHELLEQLPDVERAWADTPLGWGHFAAALFSILLLAVASFLLGRKRTQLYWETHVRGRGGAGEARNYGATTPETARTAWPGRRYVLWTLPFVIVLVTALIYASGPLGNRIDPAPLTLFLVVTGAIVLVSGAIEVWLKLRPRKLGKPVPSGRPEDRALVLRVAAAGDILAVLVVIVGALGVARSFGSLVIVGAAGGAVDPGTFWRSVVFTVLAIGVAMALALLPGRLRIESPDDPPPPSGGWLRRAALREFDPRQDCPSITGLGIAIVAVVAVTAVGFIGAAGLWPLTVGGALGIVAVTVGLLGAITSLLGLIVLSLRRRRPLALFEVLGFRSDPVIALVLVIPLVVAQLSGSVALHGVDRLAIDSEQVERPDLEQAFADWIDRSAGCESTVDGVAVRPLVVVAAEGGGIRAATWTVATLAEFADDGRCAADSVFLSSGVSGGSIGLAVAATLDRADDGSAGGPATNYPERVRAAVDDIGGSAALPAALVGLIGSDPLASMTGLRSPTFEEPTRWRDRAALIEDAWRAADDRLALPWGADPAAPTGLVVFNSTDILSGCRVVVSQVDLGTGRFGSTTEESHGGDAEGNAQRPRCDQGSAEPPLTLDLVDFFGSCSFGADWATAAMLSARFPVVTPGGVIDRSAACGAEEGAAGDDRDRLHLVDGGYAENSGLGLIADIAPDLARVLAAYNAEADVDVVPYLVYIQNSPGAYLAARAQESVPELAVPIAGFGTKATQVTPNAWIQRAMAAFDMSSEQVVIAAAGTEPSVTVPLGWGLSDATYDQLLAAARTQASSGTCAVPEWSEYHCVGELLDLFD
jgi:hypothetical protein